MEKFESKNISFTDEKTTSCGCSSTNSAEDKTISSQVEKDSLPYEITIDGKIVEVLPEDKNLIEVADRAKIAIPAPCYRAERKKGCCNACVVEVNGEQQFACNTSPNKGMGIQVNRDDLKEIRKERLLKYQQGIKNGTPCGCSGNKPV